jgi:hypothetical protein
MEFVEGQQLQPVDAVILLAELALDPFDHWIRDKRSCVDLKTRPDEVAPHDPSLQHRAAGTIDARRLRHGRTITHEGEDGKVLLA